LDQGTFGVVSSLSGVLVGKLEEAVTKAVLQLLARENTALAPISMLRCNSSSKGSFTVAWPENVALGRDGYFDTWKEKRNWIAAGLALKRRPYGCSNL